MMRLIAVTCCVLLLCGIGLRADEASPRDDRPGLVRCANLIYARNKTSVCFADHFLADVQKQTNIWTDRAFTPVRVDSRELYQYPFAVMTGEGAFTLTPEQRQALRDYLTGGGFLVASAGCSSKSWKASFQREIAAVFPDQSLTPISFEHPLFHTVYDIDVLETKSKSVRAQLMGLSLDDRIVLVYSPEGLNDTANVGGNCCCCGGNEVKNARQVNVNLLTYAVTH